MKTRFLLPCALIWALPASHLAAQSDKSARARGLSLSFVTESVVSGNPSLRELRARLSSLAQRPVQAAAWEDPRLSASSRVARFVSIAPNGFTDQMVGVEQSIPISGRNQVRARLATIEVSIAGEELRRRELDLIARARTAYFKLVRDHALIDLSFAVERSWRETIESTQTKFEVGVRSQADVLNAESELARFLESRGDLERTLSEDRTELNVLMGRPPATVLGSPVDQPRDASVPALAAARLRAVTLARRPEVRMAELRRVGASAERELARRGWIPDPAISLNAQRYNSAAQAISEVSAGISVTLPWANPAKYRAAERSAELLESAARTALEQTRLEALGRLRDQLVRVETAQHHLDLFGDRLLPLARQALEASRIDYAAGKLTFVELTAAVRALRDTETTYQHHLADRQMALAELEAVVGADLGFFPTRAKASSRRSH